jgi:hypothetical protein
MYTIGEAVRDLTLLGGTVLTKSQATRILKKLLASETNRLRERIKRTGRESHGCHDCINPLIEEILDTLPEATE